MNNIVKHAFLLALWTPLFALAWTPGTPNPDWPHVVAGQKADTWMPEEGWAFANDEPGDFSVVPAGGAALDEGFFEAPRPCTWHGFAGNTFAIPAPDGFLSLKPGTVLSEYYADIAAADPANTLLANWVELEDGEVVCDAYVNELDALHGKRIGLSDFGQLAGMLAKTDLANDRHVSETLERTENAASGFFRERGVEAGGFSISGMRQLPPHRNDTGRIAFTLAMDAGFGGETVPTANSCCILWLRGNVLFFYMAQHARSADEMESAIAESRRKLDLWCDAVLAANRWQADAAASASDTLLQERAFERTSGSDARENSSAASSFFGRISISTWRMQRIARSATRSSQKGICGSISKNKDARPHGGPAKQQGRQPMLPPRYAGMKRKRPADWQARAKRAQHPPRRIRSTPVRFASRSSPTFPNDTRTRHGL